MRDPLMTIVEYQTRLHYTVEAAVYRDILDISPNSWRRIKMGERGASVQTWDKMSQIFTPYEWYLAQEVARNAYLIGFDEDVVPEFTDLKRETLKAWGLYAGDNHPAYHVSFVWAETIDLPFFRRNEDILLIVTHKLPVMGYQDILTWRISPSHYQQYRQNPSEFFKNL